jgi:hypothetical protein
MRKTKLLTLAAIVSVLVASQSFAEEPKPDAAPPTPAPNSTPPTSTTPAAPTAPTAPTSTPTPSGEPASLTLTLPWTTPSGQGVALSYENGAFGQAWEQGLRVQIPLGKFFALTARPMVLMRLANDFNPSNEIALGGRLEVFGRSAVLLNFVRIYGGGGAGAFYDLAGTHKGKTSAGGGGEFGFEFFLHARFAFYLEVGGNGCGAVSGVCSGATAVAGMNVYAF